MKGRPDGKPHMQPKQSRDRGGGGGKGRLEGAGEAKLRRARLPRWRRSVSLRSSGGVRSVGSCRDTEPAW